ncbi:hypothetical protein [Sphingobium sp. EP60837]|uniref:hypothetical protein n=1 Tax=Sphingobium sp. EP60837 TaxID=1855519 RepID=UPI001CEDC2A5|nr:hypothetical protein [Sphingobium sp. EP60837]
MKTLDRLHGCASDLSKIPLRFQTLDREWDIERTLEANAAGIALLGLALGASVNPWFFALPAIVAGFLMQHALQGWCPPVPILRKLGFRTAREIEEERMALKAMRGDFTGVEGAPDRSYAAVSG